MLSKLYSLHICLPLKIGHIFHTPSPPMLSHCPNANSIKYIGRPANKAVSRYGTKNAPVKYNYILL